MKKLLLSAAVIALTGTALAQDTKPTIVTPDDLKWTQGPAVPKGVEAAVISGDPTKASPVLQRVRFAPNVVIPPHTHPYDEVVTVISGDNVTFGFGEKVDPSAPPTKPGTVIINPAKTPHYVRNGPEESIFQVQYVGRAVFAQHHGPHGRQ